MKLSGLITTLVVLASGVFDVEAKDSVSVKTVQSCTTAYCNLKAQHIPTSVATVHKTTKTIITETPKASTCYVTQNGKTKTVTHTVYKTYTSTAKSSTRTVTATKVIKVTSTKTVSSVSTATTSLPVVTVTEGEFVQPTPWGFVAVGDDPDNSDEKFSALPIRKRAYQSKYPTSVKCTKTLQTIYKHTTTEKQVKTTSTVYGKTITKTVTSKTTKVVYPPYAITKTVTKSTTSTIVSTTVEISTTTTTVTPTSTLPGPTSYAACSEENIFRGPRDSVGAFLGLTSVAVNADNAADCCAQCQAHTDEDGIEDCGGSYYFKEAEAASGTCMLRLSEDCSGDAFFVPQPLTQAIGTISNGPCGKWKLFSVGSIPV